MKTLQHSPDKYPHLENYSGWEIVETVTINGKEYPKAEPVYCDDSAEIWSIQTGIFFYLPEENDISKFASCVFHLKANSAQALLAALNAIQVPGAK